MTKKYKPFPATEAESYAIEKHAGGSRDTGIIIARFRAKEEAKYQAKIMRLKDKNHGYRVIKY